MGRRTFGIAGFIAAVALAASAPAWAHHDTGAIDGTLDDQNIHALHDFSHTGGGDDHVPMNVNYGFTLVGHIAPGGVQTGRYSDVWADGNFAYNGTYQEPTCDRSGVWVTDISDPASPKVATMIKSPPSTRVNDVKTIRLDNRFFKGTVLIHSLEPCGITPGKADQKGQGGISIWDVRNPYHPTVLMTKFLNFPVHNVYPWTNDQGRTFLMVVNDVDVLDTHIVEITKPNRPQLVATTGLPDWPGAQDGQSAGMGSFGASFLHDVWVKKIGTRYIALLSYWDAGWIKLDVTDPANPTFVDDSTYPDPDPVTGFSPPEGNGHAGAFNSTGSMIFAGDEDFSPYRTTFRITTGSNAGQYLAAEGAFTKPIASLPDQSMNGSTTYLGLGCNPNDTSLPGPVEDGNPLTDELAVFQRGVCFFQDKAQTAENLGYDGFIVFNDAARGDALVTMGGSGATPVPQLPGIFVGHSTGLKIFGVSDASQLTIGQSGEQTATTVEFDGWGYFHALKTGSLAELGYYAPQETNNPADASGFGDLTMHNVEGDPTNANRAFISWYSLGMRAIEYKKGFSIATPGTSAGVDDYYSRNFKEVGRFIAPDGSNFWGVHVYSHPNGTQYVLGGDRNTGLWIFKYTGGS